VKLSVHVHGATQTLRHHATLSSTLIL